MTTDPLGVRLRVAIANMFWRVCPSIRGKRRIWDLIVPREGWFPTTIGIRMRLAPWDYTSRRLILGSRGNDLVADFARSTPEGSCFLDIGSNRGPYASLAGRAVGSGGTIIAVEPNPKLWKLLLANLEEHVQGRYMLVPMAIADHAGWMGFLVDSKRHTGGGHLTAEARDGIESKLVAAQTASAVLNPFISEDVPELRIKIDTEGAEFLVLKGIESLLRRSNCRAVLVELTEEHLARFNSAESEIYDYMNGFGFKPRISMEQAAKRKDEDGYYDQWFEKPGSECGFREFLA